MDERVRTALTSSRHPRAAALVQAGEADGRAALALTILTLAAWAVLACAAPLAFLTR